MKISWIVVAAVLLAGCTQTTAPQPVWPSQRDGEATIASQVDVSATRMAGDWVIRQAYAGQPGPRRTLRLREGQGGTLQMITPLVVCADGTCDETESALVLRPAGPGRWEAAPGQPVVYDAAFWVLWMDFDSRTAAIGTPSGQFGWIMDKSATGGEDRITAARDIMAWYGYDLGRLQEVSR